MAGAKQGKKKTRLPHSFRCLFWEYDFDSLSWEEDEDLVIGKVLAEGDWKSVKLLWKRLGDDTLRDWIIRNGGRCLSPPQIRFWELMLDLPAEMVRKWLKAPGRRSWDRRTGT